ncbi:alpha/beta fold hydrolase [Roseateles sp. L2-2]|uniref:alpha/beta fold hydrolase n=1 Tax=Roseateles sp. L2-2 TaxID=3422597 RepID=UPI003D363C06
MFFQHDGHRIHFTDDGPGGGAGEGEGEGDALLFLHGLGGNALNWTYQRQHFASRRRVICLDLPGHGKSEGKSIPFLDFGDVVEGLIDHLGIDRLAVCGLSKGARVGLQLAARSPDRVSAAIAVNAFLHLSPADEAARFALYDLLLRGDEGKAIWATRLLTQMAVPEDSRIHRGFMRSLETLDGAFIRALFQQIMDADQRPEVTGVRSPTLLLRGGKDGLVPAYCHDELQSLIPDCASVVLEDCGHLPYLESPERFNLALENFLPRSVSGQSRQAPIR